MLEIGRITRPHGVRGEVSVLLTSNRTERLDPGSVLESTNGPLEVRSSRPHKGGWLVWFVGVDHRDQAEALRNVVLHSRTTVFQMGYNWKGDRNLPLTKQGTKHEIIDFVKSSLDGIDLDMTVGCFDARTQRYQLPHDENLARLDDLGEFANRPLFIVRR